MKLNIIALSELALAEVSSALFSQHFLNIALIYTCIGQDVKNTQKGMTV